LNGQRYDQDSPGLPLTDYAYTRTTFGKWKRMRPDTKVFNGQSIAKTKRVI
jgi:hypothetical protein